MIGALVVVVCSLAGLAWTLYEALRGRGAERLDDVRVLEAQVKGLEEDLERVRERAIRAEAGCDRWRARVENMERMVATWGPVRWYLPRVRAEERERCIRAAENCVGRFGPGSISESTREDIVAEIRGLQ